VKFTSNPRFRSWLSAIHPQVWILAIGRFLSEVGTGFTLFYAPIFFVNQVGLSATSVGFALGSGSVAGIAGRILGGTLADSPWGRRRTLLLSAGIAAIGSFVLAATQNFVTLVAGNLIYGFATGLYWVPTEAIVADLTVTGNRRESFAVTRLADNLGLGMGIVLAGVLVAKTSNYRLLFAIDAISFVVFFAVIWIAIKETLRPSQNQHSSQNGYLSAWVTALQNQKLRVYVVVNILFTTYISQLHSTLPLYFKNFVPNVNSYGFTETTISKLFAWHLVVAILAQLPITRILNRFSNRRSRSQSEGVSLMFSAVVWAIGFGLIWLTGVSTSGNIYWAALALTVFAVAVVLYAPSASSLVSDLAPESQRGIYLSINSLCWACGYFIGPILGGWVLDQPRGVIHYLWIGLAASVGVAIAILQYLVLIMKSENPQVP
jgi:MFS family permease